MMDEKVHEDRESTAELDRVQWYAVHVRSNQEKVTAGLLEGGGVEVFLPTYRTVSSRRDRRAVLEKPLFTGYLFVRLAWRSAERLQVLNAPGTVRIITFGSCLVPVDDEVIESIRILVSNPDGQVAPHPLVKVGKPVEVIGGPFRGARGILELTDDRRPKLVVTIGFLGRSVAAPVEAAMLRPLLEK